MKTNKLQLSTEIVRIFSLLLLMAAFVKCTGPTGADGQDGLDGINYTHSAIYDVDPAEWGGNADGYSVFLDVPEITDDIYYNGAVLVYRLWETEPKSFNLLPYTYVDNTLDGSLTVYMDFDALIGSIKLIYKEVLDGLNDTPPIENIMSFKIVIIEGIPLATLKTKVNVNDFAAVSRMFSIDNEQSILQ